LPLFPRLRRGLRLQDRLGQDHLPLAAVAGRGPVSRWGDLAEFVQAAELLLDKLLGAKFVVANSTCCGMGGTYGLKSKNAETSAAIAKESFDRIRAAGAEAVVTSCGMCRTQLAAGTGLPVYYPMELLAESLRDSPGSEVQGSK
jgi:hypothetical protein